MYFFTKQKKISSLLLSRLQVNNLAQATTVQQQWQDFYHFTSSVLPVLQRLYWHPDILHPHSTAEFLPVCPQHTVLTILPRCCAERVSRRLKTLPQTEISLQALGLESWVKPWRGCITSTPLVVRPSIRPSDVFHFAAFSCRIIKSNVQISHASVCTLCLVFKWYIWGMSLSYLYWGCIEMIEISLSCKKVGRDYTNYILSLHRSVRTAKNYPFVTLINFCTTLTLILTSLDSHTDYFHSFAHTG